MSIQTEPVPDLSTVLELQIAEQERLFVERQPRSAAMTDRASRALAGGVTSSWQITRPQAVWLSHGAGLEDL